MTTETAEGVASAATASDQVAVAALTQRVVAAWAYNDADSFAGVFVDDGTMTLPGIFLQGREAIRKYLVEAFAGPYKGTQVTGRPLDIKFFGPDSGILISLGGVLGPGQTEVSDEQAIRAAWVVVKRDGQWQLAAYMNTPARNELPAPNGSAS